MNQGGAAHPRPSAATTSRRARRPSSASRWPTPSTWIRGAHSLEGRARRATTTTSSTSSPASSAAPTRSTPWPASTAGCPERLRRAVPAELRRHRDDRRRDPSQHLRVRGLPAGRVAGQQGPDADAGRALRPAVVHASPRCATPTRSSRRPGSTPASSRRTRTTSGPAWAWPGRRTPRPCSAPATGSSTAARRRSWSAPRTPTTAVNVISVRVSGNQAPTYPGHPRRAAHRRGRGQAEHLRLRQRLPEPRWCTRPAPARSTSLGRRPLGRRASYLFVAGREPAALHATSTWGRPVPTSVPVAGRGSARRAMRFPGRAAVHELRPHHPLREHRGVELQRTHAGAEEALPATRCRRAWPTRWAR